MRKKVAIVTLFGCYNYGNRLQNYAVQRIFEKRGFEVTTLVCEKSKTKYFARHVRRVFMGVFGEQTGKRYLALRKFNKENIPNRLIFSKQGLFNKDINEEYDFFVVGSDQVWNPELRKNERDNFFLKFASREKRICIAPSIGVNRIGERYISTFKNGFDGFTYLSCRESVGAGEIERITNRRCNHIVDPTLAITATEWRTFASGDFCNKKYVVLFFLGDIDNVLRTNILAYCKANDYEILEPSNKKNKIYSINPNEFVSLIDNAELVLTDSFHAAAFSINLNTPFYVFDRHEKLESSNKMSSRIVSLVDQFDLANRHVSFQFNEFSGECDFTNANVILERERIVFDNYIEECMSQKSIPATYLPDQDCVGCGVCGLVCPSKAIVMKADFDGFLRPQLLAKKCINCGKCTRVCPIINTIKTNDIHDSYIAFNEDEKEVMESSSGAIFPLFASKVIENGGSIFGVGFNEKFEIQHKMASTEAEVKEFRKSKYVQSRADTVFFQIREKLEVGETVLFTGTPCQNAALKSYLGKEHERLFLLDFVCHGVPSPKVWDKYLQYIKSEHLCGEEIIKVDFRNKEHGWENYSMRIDSESKTYSCPRNKDLFCRAFSTNLSLRESCHECKFKGIDRVSDITIADFWGIDRICPEMKNENGTSLIIVHSEKGREMWNTIKEFITQKPIEPQEYLGKSNTAMIRSVNKNNKRNAFFSELGIRPFADIVNQYAIDEKISFEKRVLRKIKRTLKI